MGILVEDMLVHGANKVRKSAGAVLGRETAEILHVAPVFCQPVEILSKELTLLRSRSGRLAGVRVGRASQLGLGKKKRYQDKKSGSCILERDGVIKLGVPGSRTRRSCVCPLNDSVDQFEQTTCDG